MFCYNHILPPPLVSSSPSIFKNTDRLYGSNLLSPLNFNNRFLKQNLMLEKSKNSCKFLIEKRENEEVLF